MQSFSSKLVEKAVEQFATLPGIGRKTALRFALHILHRNKEEVEQFTNSILQLKESIRECNQCHNITDQETCEICVDPQRDTGTICIVEDIRDLMSIEATGQYHGIYHVLGGIISPMDGVGPADLHIDTLISRISTSPVKEIIFALRATIEGDTTGYYIYKKLPRREELIISTLSKGIAVGNDLEYTDELTLGRSIINRVAFKI
ncbi:MULTISPECIES: recombination mediator RecR [Porphyromonadaceae]|uniref:Recombination protein RecR n=1 Tax=Sanguibacteroides justesenii TaxID=1547597 RepID=A0A0C3R5H2_9PORP|nr:MULTISPECIES: recombination mediator RecR [Porphyromonadaceae]KIO43194.1 recombinase RecR [Sanguibacteroides justesenii]KIO44910.1 recombinase RecR [Sanguibacteroides justesenii]PXZ43131.1 recombination protein RecR [Sanguibacteroides justesenii]